MSATIWNMENTSVFNPDGTIRPGSLALDRPYPRAVAGKIKSFAFDPKSGKFELAWSEDPKISAPTEVYLPVRVYGGHPQISLEPNSGYQVDRNGILIIKSTGKDSARKIVVQK